MRSCGMMLPFAGNIIPHDRINEVSLKILSYLPPTNEKVVPTSQTNDYFALLPFRKTTDQIDSKADWNITEQDSLIGRFSFVRPQSYQAPIFCDAGRPAHDPLEDTS